MRGPHPHQRERNLRRQQTEAERVLWQHLRDRRLLGCKFRRQHKIDRFYADFVCLETKVIIELDGSQHLDQQAYDDARTASLNLLGYRVLRFWNDDVLIRTGEVLEAIASAVAPHPPCGHPLPAHGERETSH